MTREQKLALIVGFALVLIVGVLVSDHLSLAQKQVAGDEAGLADALQPEPESPGLGRGVSDLAIAKTPHEQQASASQDATPLDENYFTGEPPTTVADAGGTTLEQRAKRALDALADGASHVGSLIREGANENAAAAQTEFVMPSIRDEDVPPPPGLRDDGASRSGVARPEPGVDYPVHVVKKGDSLWAIAEHYYNDGTLFTKLAAFNAGRTGPDGTLRVGATLLIPSREVLTGEKSAAAPRASRRREPARGGEQSASSRRAPATKRYTVKSGDTLSEISQAMLGTSKRWREILDLNKDVLDDAESLRVGMTIKIPAR